MASMRDIKRRKSSVQSTQQITKAMKLVSTVKLQKSKTKAEASKAYFDCMQETVAQILSKTSNISNKYLQEGQSTKKACIVISGNKGLAGGYNSNVVKMITESDMKKDDVIIYAVGRKGKEALERKGYYVKADYSEVVGEPLFSDAVKIGHDVLEGFANGEFGEIYLIYTRFKNTVSQESTMIKLLPVKNDEKDKSEVTVDDLTLMNFEPEPEEALDLIIPKYINSLIFGGLMESVASENGARMQAMDNATNNAETMIDNLSLKYNRARQAAITQELTEIVAGASAIS